jgi:hypothetical protein
MFKLITEFSGLLSRCEQLLLANNCPCTSLKVEEHELLAVFDCYQRKYCMNLVVLAEMLGKLLEYSPGSAVWGKAIAHLKRSFNGTELISKDTALLGEILLHDNCRYLLEDPELVDSIFERACRVINVEGEGRRVI